jgi:hypothetical protein
MKRTTRLRDGNRLNSDLNLVQDNLEDIVKTLSDHDRRIKKLERFCLIVFFLIIALIAIILTWEIVR